jgi:hypothetical protein
MRFGLASTVGKFFGKGSMRNTIISFDPEARVFGYVSEFEKTYDAEWLYCEAFETFLNYMMKISGGILILPHSQLASVESCLGTEQSTWRIFVLVTTAEAQSQLAAERTHYTVATRATLTSTLSQLLNHSTPDTAESEGGTLAEAQDFEDRKPKPNAPIFSMDELAEFEAEMDQAFAAVGEIDPEADVDLSVFDNESETSKEPKYVDPAVMTMELAVSDLEDLEDVSGIFDMEDDLDASVMSSSALEIDETQAGDHDLLAETMVVDPDVVIEAEDEAQREKQEDAEEQAVLSSTPLEATQIISPDLVDGVFVEGTQVIDDEMIEDVLVDGTQVIDDEMIEEVLVDGTQVVDEAMVESAHQLTQDIPADQIDDVLVEGDHPAESASVQGGVIDQDFLKGFLDEADDDLSALAQEHASETELEAEASLSDGDERDSIDLSEELTLGQSGAEFEIAFDDEQVVVEVDAAQVLDVSEAKETGNPREIMAVDAEMVLETIAETHVEPTPLIVPAATSSVQKEELVTLRKRLLELQLDLKLSKEQGEALRIEVNGRRIAETKLREDLRGTESQRREIQVDLDSLRLKFSKQEVINQANTEEVRRLSELTETQGSTLSESRNRQDMLESAREAAEYELETVSKRYGETKARLEKKRGELGELEQEFKQTKKKFKKDAERQNQNETEVVNEHKRDVRKLKEQLQSIEKLLASKEEQFSSLSETKRELEVTLAQTVRSSDERFEKLSERTTQETERLSQTLAAREEKLTKLERDHQESLANGSRSHSELVEAHQSQRDDAEAQHKTLIEQLTLSHETALKTAISGLELSANQAQEQAKAEREVLERSSEESLGRLRTDYEERLEALESQLLAARQRGDVQLTTVRTELSDRNKQDLEQLELEHAELMERQTTTLRKEYDQLLESRLSDHGGALVELREKYQTDTAQLRESYEAKMASAVGGSEATIERIRAEHREDLLSQETQSKSQMEALQKSTSERIDELRGSHKTASIQSEAQHESSIQSLRDEQSAQLEALKSEHRAHNDAAVEKASVSLEALRAELEGRHIEQEASLKSTAETRLQEHKDEALRQRTDFEAQIGLLKQGNEELKAEVERARLAAHQRVRQEALAENEAQVAALEARITGAEEKHQVAESAWASKQAALEEEYRVKAAQSEEESQALQQAHLVAQERTAAVAEELDQVRHLLSESNTRIDGLSEELKKETLRFNEASDGLKAASKSLRKAEVKLQEAEIESANLARDFAAKAADLESTYKIDQALRRDLETSLTDMGQSLAQRETELMEGKQTIDRLNAKIGGLETDNRSLVSKSEDILSRFRKVRALLVEDDETETED